MRDLERPLIVWFRRDLRVADNPALQAAVATGLPVIPLYILDDARGPWALGGASRWWLHESLRALGADVAKLGAPLILRRGAAAAVLDAVIRETQASGVYWNRCYDPHGPESAAAAPAPARAQNLARAEVTSCE